MGCEGCGPCCGDEDVSDAHVKANKLLTCRKVVSFYARYASAASMRVAHPSIRALLQGAATWFPNKPKAPNAAGRAWLATPTKPPRTSAPIAA